MKDKKAIVWKIVQFQNGSNKVAIELRVVQFWSEIILSILKSLTSVTIIYQQGKCSTLSCLQYEYSCSQFSILLILRKVLNK